MTKRTMILVSAIALLGNAAFAASHQENQQPAASDTPSAASDDNQAQVASQEPGEPRITHEDTGFIAMRPRDIPDDKGFFIYSADGQRAFRMYGSLRMLAVFDDRQNFHAFDVTLRIEASQGGPGQQLGQAIDRSEELHSEMWSRAVAIADQQPTPISALFVQSLNEVIDAHEERITVGIHYRLSGVTWMVLYGLLILAMAMGGYETGVSGRRRLIVIALWTALAFSVVLVLVVALDRPHQHLSTATQAAMFDLQENIRLSIESQP